MADESRTDVARAEHSSATLPSQARPHPEGGCDRGDWLSFIATTTVALVAYAFTLAPEVTLGFSGIMSTGAMYAGVPHPPGYPLWTLYSWLAVQLLPFGNIAWRVAFGSAIASAFACGLVALMVSFSAKRFLAADSRIARLNPVARNLLCGVCGYAAGLVFGFTGAVWRQAVVADIWAVSLLAFSLMLWLLLRWQFEPERKEFLITAFLLFGLLLSDSQQFIVTLPAMVGLVMLVRPPLGRDLALLILPIAAWATRHHQYHAYPRYYYSEEDLFLILAFAVTALAAIAVAVWTRRVGTEWRIACLCGFLFLSGLSLCYYPVIAAMTNPPVNWAYPRSVEGFLHLVGRGQYERVRPVGDLGTFIRQSWMVLGMTGREFGWLYLALGVLPFAWFRVMDRRGRVGLLSLGAVFACVGPLLLSVLNPPADLQAVRVLRPYFGGAYVVLAIWLGLGLVIVGARMTRPPD